MRRRQQLAEHVDDGFVDASMARREDCIAVGGRKHAPLGASCWNVAVGVALGT